MVMDGHSKGYIYSYLACMSLMASALLAPQLSGAAEPANVDAVPLVALSLATAEEYSSLLAAGAPWLAASGDGIVVVGVGELFNTAEARGRRFIASHDRKFRAELSGWFATQSSIASKLGSTLLSKHDGGLSVGVGIDELSVDWTVKF